MANRTAKVATPGRPFDANVLFRRLMTHAAPGAAQPPLAWMPTILPAMVGGKRIDRPIAETLGRLGSLEVRLATTPADIRRAQSLRFHVFYEEMAALPSPAAAVLRRDADAFDAICDHVLVLDHDDIAHRPFRKPEPRVVATYRLLRQEVADINGGFYSEGEYEIETLAARHPGLRLLELGRSCVLKPYRNKRTVELLWHGVWRYILHHRIDAMFGCASLEGTDPALLALPLSFLRQHCRAPEDWRVSAVTGRQVAMDRLPAASVDAKAALKQLPPLIKGYLRLGAFVGEHAVIDRQFGTTDVLIVLPTARISERYIDHFGADASRHAVR